MGAVVIQDSVGAPANIEWIQVVEFAAPRTQHFRESVGGEELQVLPGLSAESHLQRMVVRRACVFLISNPTEIGERTEFIDHAAIQRLTVQRVGQVYLRGV